MAQSKEVKAIYEEFQQMHLARSIKEAERERHALQEAVEQTNRQLAKLTQQLSLGTAGWTHRLAKSIDRAIVDLSGTDSLA